MTAPLVRFVDRVNDGGNTIYQVKQGLFYLGEVTFIRPGVWMVTGCLDEFSTRREAGEYLRREFGR